jgi:hypothetical protein
VKLTIKTTEDPYFLQVYHGDVVLATAAAESGPRPPKRFFIWSGDPMEVEEKFEGEEAYRFNVEGRDPHEVWEQIEFQIFKIAMAEWERLKDQGDRTTSFYKNLNKATELMSSLQRLLDLKFDLEDQPISKEINDGMKLILERLREAEIIADQMYDP